MFTIRTLLSQAKSIAFIEQTEAELILAHVLKKSREFVLAHPEYEITENEKQKIENMIQRRKDGEPLAYIVGKKEFYGRDFIVNDHTLIPRPETELLVEKILPNILGNKKITLIDVGTGSGCIIVSIIKELLHSQFTIHNLQFLATDISKEALKIAKQNAKKYNVSQHIQFLHSDILKRFLQDYSLLTTTYSLLIIANLPYVPKKYLQEKKNTLTRGLRYEPKHALDGGSDGLDLYRKLLRQTKKLKSVYPHADIASFYEIGNDQKETLAQEITSQFSQTSPAFYKDLAGHWRIARFIL